MHGNRTLLTPVNQTIAALAAISVCGIACQWLAWRVRVPASLFLLLALRTVRPTARVAEVLRWEGIMIDPIGAVVMVLAVGARVGARPYFFISISRKRSTASLGPKSSGSNSWRTSISLSDPSPWGLGKRLAQSTASSRDFTWISV